MVKSLQLAIQKASELPAEAQEQLGRELLERIETLTQLRSDIAAGISELDAGQGEPLDVEEMIRQLRADHAAEK